MKKSFIGVILFSFLFISCLIPKQAPNEKVEVIIKNTCNWSVNLKIEYPNYNIADTNIRLGENDVKLNLYKGIPVNIFIKGAYDIYPKYVYIQSGVIKNQTWTFEWSTYDNCYIFMKDNVKIRIN